MDGNLIEYSVPTGQVVLGQNVMRKMHGVFPVDEPPTGEGVVITKCYPTTKVSKFFECAIAAQAKVVVIAKPTLPDYIAYLESVTTYGKCEEEIRLAIANHRIAFDAYLRKQPLGFTSNFYFKVNLLKMLAQSWEFDGKGELEHYIKHIPWCNLA